MRIPNPQLAGAVKEDQRTKILDLKYKLINFIDLNCKLINIINIRITLRKVSRDNTHQRTTKFCKIIEHV